MKALAALALAALVIANSSNALTAPADGGPRGEGAVAVSGVVITDVSYEVDARDPGLLQAVKLTLDRPAQGSVRLKLGSETWRECDGDGTRAHCPTPGVRVAAVDRLRVIVA